MPNAFLTTGVLVLVSSSSIELGGKTLRADLLVLVLFATGGRFLLRFLTGVSGSDSEDGSDISSSSTPLLSASEDSSSLGGLNSSSINVLREEMKKRENKPVHNDRNS